jgi:hypothetical protein
MRTTRMAIGQTNSAPRAGDVLLWTLAEVRGSAVESAVSNFAGLNGSGRSIDR